MDKVLTKQKAKVGSIVSFTSAKAIEKYASLSEKVKEMEAELKGIREWAASVIENGGEVKSELGELRVVVSEKLSWNVDDLKEMFGKNWHEYVTADNKLVKAKVESVSANDQKEADKMLKLAAKETSNSVRMFKN